MKKITLRQRGFKRREILTEVKEPTVLETVVEKVKKVVKKKK